MKRTFVFITAILLLLPLLAACNRSSGTDYSALEKEDLASAGYRSGNEAADFTLYYPNDWELADNSGIVMIRKDVDDSEITARYASISAIAFALTETSQGARDYWNSYKKDIGEAFKDFKMIGETSAAEGEEQKEGEEITLGGTVALKVRYSASITGSTYLYDQVICCRNAYVYIITLTSTTDDYDSVKDALDTVVKYFEFN